MPNKLPVVTLAVIYGTAGMSVLLLPIMLSVPRMTEPLFALIGVGGLLLAMTFWFMIGFTECRMHICVSCFHFTPHYTHEYFL